MSEKEIRHLGVVFLHHLCQLVHILYNIEPAVPVREITVVAVIVNAAAVSEMILSADNEAVIRKVVRKGVVAFKVFRHAVCYLHHSPDVPYREHDIIGNIVGLVR